MPMVSPDMLEGARARAKEKVAALRAQNPGQESRALGERLVRSAANRAGLWGAATSALSLVAPPVGLPAGVAVSLVLEAELIFALLEAYGLGASGEAGQVRLYALWAGAGFAGAARGAGLRLGARAMGRVLTGSLPARLIARINPLLLRAILERLGMGWLPRAMKLWPILGAPVGFAIDRSAVRALGAATLATLDSVAGARHKARRPSRRKAAQRKVVKRGDPRAARTRTGPSRR